MTQVEENQNKPLDEAKPAAIATDDKLFKQVEVSKRPLNCIQRSG